MRRFRAMVDNPTLFGPFSQIVTGDKLKAEGPLLDDELEILHDAGIIISSGNITAIGSYESLKKQCVKTASFGSKAVALPGFIDAHTHICWAGSRSRDYALRLQGYTYQEIAKEGGGILDTVKQTRQASKEELAASMIERLKILRMRGITTCEVKSGYGLAVNEELKMLEAIRQAQTEQSVTLVPTCLAAHIRPPEFDSNGAYLSYLIEELLPEILRRGLSRRVDIFVEDGAFSSEEALNYLAKAKGMGFTACVHADQFSRGGALVAAKAGAISADHLEVSSVEDLRALKKGKVIPVVLPGASLGLGIPFAPARQILDENLPLTIASDWNPGSAPQGDLLTQAALLGASEKLTMAETLRAITSNAARALGLKDRGILRAGMRADIALFPTDDYRDIFYYQGSLKPSEVIVGGKQW